MPSYLDRTKDKHILNLARSLKKRQSFPWEKIKEFLLAVQHRERLMTNWNLYRTHTYEVLPSKRRKNEAAPPDFVIAYPKNLHQRVSLFSDVLPSALFGCKPPCSEVA